MDTPLLVSSILDRAAKCFPEREIISYDASGNRSRYDYRTLDARCRMLAGWLRELGMLPGDRIATLAWNDHRHLELYFAVSSLGCICHTINPRLDDDTLAYIIGHAGDRMLFFDAAFGSVVDRLRERISTIAHYVVLGDDYSAVSDVRYEDCVAAAPIDAWPMLDENQASGLCYTSGTTGQPKGVLYSQRSTVLHAMACAHPDAFGIRQNDVVMPVVPMFHVNAWGLPHVAAMAGASLVLPGPRLDGKSLSDVIQNDNVTFAAGVPTIWHGLMAHLEQSGAKLPSVDRFVIGGAALPGPMIEYFEEQHGITMIQGWGMTETSPVCTISKLTPSEKVAPRAVRTRAQMRQGKPLFGVELSLDVSDNGGNELLVRGPWIASSYYNRDEELLRDGWMPTGDIAVLDKHQTLTITDRAKDLIKSGGEWMSSAEIEAIAVAHPNVRQAAAIGIPDGRWGERPVVFVVLNDQRTQDAATVEEIKAKFVAECPRWKVPDAIILADTLPLGATGKVLKTKLREAYLPESATGD